ncbi:hypothetical protein N7532_000333 [Penicillium argentinense]|uniref:Uncharacterized protein n=1 Tax=Penicillium argentinense TaxID=1131581 RepID=A0A9W9KNS0_9EURO|nr:uncharacterized protein N7532_000333 [Penicillium argentinense]KAJ5112288.1 hypothetical protein N7532_000333 [Penicillium argentinense]
MAVEVAQPARNFQSDSIVLGDTIAKRSRKTTSVQCDDPPTSSVEVRQEQLAFTNPISAPLLHVETSLATSSSVQSVCFAVDSHIASSSSPASKGSGVAATVSVFHLRGIGAYGRATVSH